ncbi:MAG TPA: hypothetical protein PLD52_02125 [Bacteroidales bacterium]|nr:hypothetical protein [Bacteroidales bacterium]
MSIAIALISKDNGAVGSDTLIYSGATYENNVITKWAEKEDEPYSKVRRYKRLNILLAVTGMMRLNGNDVLTEIERIIDTYDLNSGGELKKVAEFVASEVHKRIMGENIRHLSKNFQLILLSQEKLFLGDYMYYYYVFTPIGGSISMDLKEIKSSAVLKGRYFHYLPFGDTLAQDAIHKAMKSIKIEEKNARQYYFKVIDYAIREGITHCGPHPEAQGTHPSCGGTPSKILI